MRSSVELEVWGSNLGSVELDTVLPVACHRCNHSLKGALFPAGPMMQRWALLTPYARRCDRASIVKGLILKCKDQGIGVRVFRHF